MTYAIWTGVGMIGTNILSCFLFGESFPLHKILYICLILIGLIGLRL